MLSRLPNLAQQHPAHSIQDVSDALPNAREIIETMTFRAGYNTSMVIAGTTLLGLAAGIIGVFALLRKRSLMTDALSHATLPGITLAFLIAGALGLESKSLPVLLIGATITGVLGVICVQLILRHTRLREDAAIGIVLSVFFGFGIVGLSYIQANTPSNSGGLNHFIYGQAATMRAGDVILMGSIALAAIVMTMLFLKEFAIVCFNDAFARVDGWPIGFVDLLMMALVVLVTVAGLQAVGLILVVSMLIIPPVAARFWTDRLGLLVLISGVVGAMSGYLGAVLSALFPRKPAGAVIVLTAGIVFALSMFLAPKRGVIAHAYRRIKLRFRIAGDHLLEFAYESGQASLDPASITEFARTQGWSKFFSRVVLARLRRDGMIDNRAERRVELTNAGHARGARVSRNHALWEQYLVSYADIAPSHVDWSVDMVEHVLSDTLIKELESALVRRGIKVPVPAEGRA
jgi:manganese/zinc/iron transport system permease protein